MKYPATLLLLFFCLVSYSQNRILVDGVFNEWADYPIIYSDATGDSGGSGVDFGQLQIYNDAEFIFFLLETGSEINLQDLNEISIYLDTDENTSTGFSINGIGAELVYSFGNRTGLFYTSGNSIEIIHNDLFLVTAPTVTSTQFEIAIRRDATVSGAPLFQSDNLTAIFKDDISNGDILPSEIGGIAYTFSNDPLEPLPEYSIQKTEASDLRIMSYNVLSNGLFDQSRIPSFTRLLQATQPDIIGFQEIYDYSSAQVANQVESMLPSTPGQQWYHAMEEPDCHAISRYPIVASAQIPGYNQGAGNGAFLIDVPDSETDLLLIVAHPPCCTNNSGRQIEVDLIMEFLREAKEGNGPIPLVADAPIIIIGDMNLVGDRRQLETLLTGDIFDESSYGPDFNPDWDGNDLLDSKPYTTGLPFSYTWYNEGSNFSPGKLDYIIYSGSNLTQQNNYSLFTPSLPQDSLDAFNLFANDAVVASDHLPIIADFAIKNLTAQEAPLSNQNVGFLEVYPNPSHGLTEVSFSIRQQNVVVVQLIDQSGKEVAILHHENLNAGEHTLQFDTTPFSAGIYFIKLKTADFTSSKKIIIN